MIIIFFLSKIYQKKGKNKKGISRGDARSIVDPAQMIAAAR